MTPRITAIAITPASASIGVDITAVTTITSTPATDRGNIVFYTSTTPTVSASWAVAGVQPISAQVSGTISCEWQASLESGTYYVKAILCDATLGYTYDSYDDGELTAVTYTLAGETAYTDNLVQSVDLRLCDAQNRPTIIVNKFTNLTYTNVWGGPDEFSLSIPRTATNADQLLVGRLILMPADDTHSDMRALVIKQIRVDEDSISVSGNDYLWALLDSRLITDGTAAGTGYDEQTEVAAETAARHYINANCLEATDTARQDPFVVFETERATPLGDTVTYKGRYQTLATCMESICTQGKINLYGEVIEDDSLERGWYIEARFTVGTDHSQDLENANPWVVLSEEFGNAVMTEYVDNVPDCTVVEVRGSGSGASRLSKTVGDTTLAGTSRRESYVDASDCTDNDSMEAKGQEVLDDAVNRSVEMKLTKTSIYGKDFVIGDTVTCDVGIYGSYNLQVTEVETEYTGAAVTITVNLGAEISGVMSVIRDAIQAIPLRRQ